MSNCTHDLTSQTRLWRGATEPKSVPDEVSVRNGTGLKVASALTTEYRGIDPHGALPSRRPPT